MDGPWANYQSQGEQGPWAKYGAPPNSAASPIAPPKLSVGAPSGEGMHPSYLMGNPNSDATTPSMDEMAKGALRSVADVTAPVIAHRVGQKMGIVPKGDIYEGEGALKDIPGKATMMLTPGLEGGEAEAGMAAPKTMPEAPPTPKTPPGMGMRVAKVLAKKIPGVKLASDLADAVKGPEVPTPKPAPPDYGTPQALRGTRLPPPESAALKTGGKSGVGTAAGLGKIPVAPAELPEAFQPPKPKMSPPVGTPENPFRGGRMPETEIPEAKEPGVESNTAPRANVTGRLPYPAGLNIDLSPGMETPGGAVVAPRIRGLLQSGEEAPAAKAAEPGITKKAASQSLSKTLPESLGNEPIKIKPGVKIRDQLKTAEPKESSVVKSSDYDPATKRLGVTTPNGEKHIYAEVPPEVAQGLEKADSKGTFYNNEIRQNFKRVQKILPDGTVVDIKPSNFRGVTPESGPEDTLPNRGAQLKASTKPAINKPASEDLSSEWEKSRDFLLKRKTMGPPQ